MGNCLGSSEIRHVKLDEISELSKLDEKKITQYIDRHMKVAKKHEGKVKKLLLLGSGSAGKSTIFKQIKIIHGNGFEVSELKEYRAAIRQNCVTGILSLLKKSSELYELNPEKYDKCRIDNCANYDNTLFDQFFNITLRFANESFIEVGMTDNLKLLGEAIKYIWGLQPIKETFVLRGDRFSFPDNMEYFFDKISIIMNNNYAPDTEDIFKTRIRTTGIIESEYVINDNMFFIYDVGGQKNERKKWIYAFENVTGIIFVAALNGYNSVLFEDENRNMMEESIELFDNICNSKWFRQTEIILFLNKADLFRECLRQGILLSDCFKNWDGIDYIPKNDGKDEIFFEQCYNIALQFIQDQYVCKNQNPYKVIFCHVTTAIDRDNIKKVFWDVQNIVIRSNLKRTHLL